MHLSVYPLLKRFVWLRRLPHRQGYGIHSPFAYNLVRGVIYEEGEFYAYKELHKRRRAATLREKDDRLLLRLANDFQPRQGLVCGPGTDVTRHYLQAGCTSCPFEAAANVFAPSRPILTPLMAFVQGAERFQTAKALLNNCKERALIVLHGIHADHAARQQWHRLLNHEAISISFDLYDFGLLYVHLPLSRQDYIINYL